jgi:hypothetical protein
MPPLSPDRAAAFAAAALDAVTRVYPNVPQLVLQGPDDLRHPAEVHPTFHTALDWHSSVHMHWSLLRLRRCYPDAVDTDAIDALVADHLTVDKLRVEAAYLAEHPAFERPYGWAWALALAAEAARGVDIGIVADEVGAATTLLADEVDRRWMDHLPAATYPTRTGTHGNTAFAALVGLDAARRTGREALAERLVATARRWYLLDRDAPAAYEPSGEDFLSPALTEAHLLADVLGPDDFADWLDAFLPGIADVIPGTLADPPVVSDASDYRIVHLHGLTLSRAWSWRAIAGALPPRDERRVAALDAADRHLAAGLDTVVSGDFGGDHWLVSFALLASDGLGA